jgi:hypothetical protein
LSRKATLLLAEILALATRVLPMNAAAGIQVGTKRHSEVFSRLILLFFSLFGILKGNTGDFFYGYRL